MAAGYHPCPQCGTELSIWGTLPGSIHEHDCRPRYDLERDHAVTAVLNVRGQFTEEMARQYITATGLSITDCALVEQVGKDGTVRWWFESKPCAVVWPGQEFGVCVG